MRLAPFALLALCALPACAPYGYGYAESYGGPVYGAPAPEYGAPYYAEPGYAAPPASGLLLFGGDRRNEGRNEDYRREGRRDDRYSQQRRPEPSRPAGRVAAPPQRQAPAFVAPRGGGGGGGGGGHAPDFNPANPGGGADR